MACSIREALALASKLSSSTPALDVELLLAHVLDRDRAYLRTWPDRVLSDSEQTLFDALLHRRAQGEPVAHILGSQSFWTLDLKVSSNTLIPRPDTEILVQEVLALPLEPRIRILDLGTGTGALALALASEKPDWEVYSSDTSEDIIELARENARRNGIEGVHFLTGDWFEALPDQLRFAVIVSNPPYIDESDWHLSQGDVRFEPATALVSANEGLRDLSHLVSEAPAYLECGGWLLLEHGYEQAGVVQKLMHERGYQGVRSAYDYGGHQRVTVGQWRHG